MKHRFLFLVLLIPSLALAQEQPRELFREEEPIEIKIVANIRETISDKEERKEHEAKLIFKGNDGERSLDIKLQVRGNTRANPTICKFPPLRVNFKKKQVAGTIFNGQNKLKLVTHCNTREINEQYVLREYYVYKLYNLVTPYSFKVRLCRIIYEDTEGKYDTTPHYGFLIEDTKDVAKRMNMETFKGKIMNQDVCYRPVLDDLTLFEYLIGNLDWSISERHNFKLIYGEETKLPVPVPYDFDFSGIVNTSYAKPPPQFDIPSVRKRIFRGFCREDGGYDPAIDHYKELKNDIYSLYTTSPYLNEKSIDQTIKYLDSFYKIVDNPKALRSEILEACPVNHKHVYSR